MSPARLGAVRRAHFALASVVAVVPASLAGCEIKLDPGLPRADAAQPDASPDAPPDAPPDARLCAGGDARVTEATTGSCFLLFNTNRTHTAAQADCVANASHLAIIKSAAVNTAVTTLVGSRDVFLGATDAVTEGTFLWPDTTGLSFTNFRSGEPNNGGGNGEDCLVLEGQRNGSWDDRPCNLALSYVCQF